MLSPWIAELLRCPETGEALTRTESGWRRPSDGKLYADSDGMTALVWPVDLVGEDAAMNKRSGWRAPFYDGLERVLGWLLTGVNMARGRQQIVDLLDLDKGMRLLEVSPGPGVFQPMLRRKIGPEAEFAAIDLSRERLEQCRLQHGAERVQLIQANALNLPFADKSFDALFHFGCVNLFSDPDQALAEFVRVVRPGGIVAWGDERMSENFTHPLGRMVLPRLNPGFLRRPPAMPAGLRGPVVHEVYDGLGYLVVARKHEKSTKPVALEPACVLEPFC